MFVDAIKMVAEFTRPIYTITREYGSDLVIPSTATLFFINELGHAITCKHVAAVISQAEKINNQYETFKKEREVLPRTSKFRKKLKELERKFHYKKGVTVQIKTCFINCVEPLGKVQILPHPKYDLAIMQFSEFEKLLYTSYATFLKDDSKIQQGKSLCRLGYPFPEFSNYNYNESRDDIEWSSGGKQATPRFPIDGIITRNLLDEAETVFGIELSTPGLKGQSGGPLFNSDGLIYGMQSSTHHLHLGFDIKGKEIREGSGIKKVSNYPFLHLGMCVHASIIKSFLKEKNIRFYEG